MAAATQTDFNRQSAKFWHGFHGLARILKPRNEATGHRRPTGFRVRPDFVFRPARLAVFVDGCFWHGCPQHGTQPKGNAAFWKVKFARNQARDRRVNRALRRAGWHVLRIWEHALRRATKDKRNEARLLRRIQGKFSGIRLNH